MKKSTIAILVVLFTFSMFRWITGNTPPKFPIHKTKFFADNGKQLDIEDFKGKVVLVSFFQSWCGDCRKELPELVQLQQAVGGKEQLEILLISDENWDKINMVKQTTQTPLNCYQAKEALKKIGIKRYPTTYLLDKKGNVVTTKVEGIYWNTPEIQQQIKDLN